MPNKFYSFPKSVFEHYHDKLKSWVVSILPTKTSDLTNDSDFLNQLALAGIIASTFSTSSTYAVGDYVLYNHTLYRCKTAISTAGAWDSSKWDATKTQDIFQGSAPGLVPAPASASQVNNAFLSGTGSWNNMTPVTNAKIDEMFIETITIGGRNYPIIKIGNQLWMTENLDFKYEGITIGGSAVSDSTPLANYYNNDEATYGVNGNKYGLLYNGASVNLMQTNASTIFPTGWNIASASDYTTLFNYVNSFVKLRSTSGWTGTQGTNEFGFNAVPSGQRSSSMGDWAYRDIGTLAKYWTRTISAPYNGYAYINSSNSGGSNSSGDSRQLQLAVRLVKNLT